MPQARKHQINLSDTLYYHCVSRCVRRAYLCGNDKLTGKSYEHRRQWVEDKLLFLTTVFSIEVCAYAIMSNHLHVVLHVNQDKPKLWSDKAVLANWHQLHKGTLLSQQYMNDSSSLTDAQNITLKSTIDVYRQRLMDISWFMRELNEPIARRANKEDNCTGHFWESRFKSQALLDEHALAACMVYVDLNPIRANIATMPETSEHTSIKRRLCDMKKGYQPATLKPFITDTDLHQSEQLPFNLIDYINLVDTSGRAIKPNQPGAISPELSPILQRLGVDEKHWCTLICSFETLFSIAAGQADTLKLHKRRHRRQSHCA